MTRFLVIDLISLIDVELFASYTLILWHKVVRLSFICLLMARIYIGVPYFIPDIVNLCCLFLN